MMNSLCPITGSVGAAGALVSLAGWVAGSASTDVSLGVSADCWVGESADSIWVGAAATDSAACIAACSDGAATGFVAAGRCSCAAAASVAAASFCDGMPNAVDGACRRPKNGGWVCALRSFGGVDTLPSDKAGLPRDDRGSAATGNCGPGVIGGVTTGPPRNSVTGGGRPAPRAEPGERDSGDAKRRRLLGKRRMEWRGVPALVALVVLAALAALAALDVLAVSDNGDAAGRSVAYCVAEDISGGSVNTGPLRLEANADRRDIAKAMGRSVSVKNLMNVK